jgi:hypothetical protein
MSKAGDSEYWIKPIVGNTKAFTISKFIDGDFKEAYVTEPTECQCKGAIYHRTQCKHMRILIAWQQLGSPTGCYFTVNKKGDPNVHFIPDQGE